MGEILILRNGGEFILLHCADENDLERLQTYTSPNDALEISRYDEAGKYRPLKSAPNLRRGWKLHLKTLPELHLALDFFYPAMAGVWLAFLKGRLAPVHFRETAGRQSGMYDVVKKIGNEQADTLVGDFCKSGGRCLKTILWQIDPATSLTKLPPSKFDPQADQTGGMGQKNIPLLCNEACNLLIAAARNVVRKPGGRE